METKQFDITWNELTGMDDQFAQESFLVEYEQKCREALRYEHQVAADVRALGVGGKLEVWYMVLQSGQVITFHEASGAWQNAGIYWAEGLYPFAQVVAEWEAYHRQEAADQVEAIQE